MLQPRAYDGVRRYAVDQLLSLQQVLAHLLDYDRKI